MARPSRAAIVLDIQKRVSGKYGWAILRGEEVIGYSTETYARSDAARRSLRHVVTKLASQVGLTVKGQTQKAK